MNTIAIVLEDLAMSTEAVIEERLAAVEQEVAGIKQRLAHAGRQGTWIDRFTGAFKDEPAFADVVEHGRAIREADRPTQGEPE